MWYVIKKVDKRSQRNLSFGNPTVIFDDKHKLLSNHFTITTYGSAQITSLFAQQFTQNNITFVSFIQEHNHIDQI